MRPKALLLILTGLFFSAATAAAGEGDASSPKTPKDLSASIQRFSEGLFLKKTTQAAQAGALANTRSDFGLELRPRVTDDDAGVALRIYLPARWRQGRLREQLELVAQSEELRVAAMEWQELLAAYRTFCEYRMLQKQIVLCTDELELLEPYLAKADLAVERRELKVTDRAKLVSQYLDLLNNREQRVMDLMDTQLSLFQVLGSSANLEALAPAARLDVPTQIELDDLFAYAMEHRADYRQLGVDTEALSAAESVARAEDGFRFKYLQPAYNADYTGGEDTWGLSAAFVLPWGSKNPDITEFQKQQELAEFEMALQRRIIKERFQALLQASEALLEQVAQRNRLIQPLLDQLTIDLDQMSGNPLDRLRDRLQISERILDTALQAAELECKREQLAVDFAEELGSLEP